MASGLTLRAVAICRGRSFFGLHISSSKKYSAISCVQLFRDEPRSTVRRPDSFCSLSTSLVHSNQLKHNKDSVHSSDGKKNGEQRTLFQRFKDDFARYWYVMLPIHISTSFGYFLCFYYLSKAGVNPAPLMDLIGVPAQYVDPIRDSTASHVAVGYAGYKLITPFRYITTIAVTGYTVRTLSSKGILKPMPTFSEFKRKIKSKFNSLKGK